MPWKTKTTTQFMCEDISQSRLGANESERIVEVVLKVILKNNVEDFLATYEGQMDRKKCSVLNNYESEKKILKRNLFFY